MKLFLNHARKDEDLARDLRAQLKRAGFAVWDPDDEISARGNWATKVARALDNSELMVLLVTPRAFRSDTLRHNVEFAIGSIKYANRLFSVFVGSRTERGKGVPWILLELPHREIDSAKGFREVVKDIRKLAHANG
jgi:hypothetical protein